MGSVRNVLRPSGPSDVRPKYNRPKFARALPRVVPFAGFQMCSDLVSLIPEGQDGLRKWRATPNAVAGVFKVKCAGSSRKRGRAARKLRIGKVIRGAAQPARRILDTDTRELLRIARAYFGSDEVRAPY